MERRPLRPSGAHLALLGVVLSLAACRDIPGPLLPPPSPLTVSDTASRVSTASPGSALSLSTTLEPDVVYISLLPGTTPDGELAIIRNPRTGSTEIVPLVAGGFDPVAVSAAVGDTIAVVVRDASGAVVLEMRVAVAATRRPIVVRTDPPPRKRDVPLNASVIIVFSEPIDPATLIDASVQLFQGATLIAGRLEFRDPDHLTTAFVPAAPLDAATTYQLVVTQGIRDLDGEPLEAPVSVTFTTGSTVLQAASVTVMPETLRAVGAPVEVWVLAIVRDANGTELFNVPVQWSSSNSSVAPLQPNGTFEAGRNMQLINAAGIVGSATITATISGARPGTGTFVFDTLRMSAVSVGANGGGMCALTSSGQAFCEGFNNEGELGIGFAGGGSVRLVAVTGGFTFTAISNGHSHSCALTSTGAAYCWGGNSYGQVGVPPSYAEPRPTPVSGGLTFRSISVGLTHSCGLVVSGDAYCWGGGWPGQNNGQLGNGSTSNRSTPVAVVGGLTFAEISAEGEGHTCGLTPGGAVYCWGWNAHGQLGNGSFTNSASPVVVVGGLTFAHISAGSVHTCAVTTDGATYCWGDPGMGWAVGAPASSSPELVPLPVAVALAQIDAGLPLTCGLTADGAAYCWGFHPGSNGPDIWEPPTRFAGNIRFVSVSSGIMKWCGVTLEPDVYCEAWSMAP